MKARLRHLQCSFLPLGLDESSALGVSALRQNPDNIGQCVGWFYNGEMEGDILIMNRTI